VFIPLIRGSKKGFMGLSNSSERAHEQGRSESVTNCHRLKLEAVDGKNTLQSQVKSVGGRWNKEQRYGSSPMAVSMDRDWKNLYY